jgi:regulator of replication initiation timing
MNLKKEIKKLRKKNLKLQLENMNLRIKLQRLSCNEWVHPKSCLHNDDPWKHL